MPKVKNDAKSVVSLSIGMVGVVRVADTDLGVPPGIGCIEGNGKRKWGRFQSVTD